MTAGLVFGNRILSADGGYVVHTLAQGYRGRGLPLSRNCRILTFRCREHGNIARKVEPLADTGEVTALPWETDDSCAPIGIRGSSSRPLSRRQQRMVSKSHDLRSSNEDGQ
jgi:hypothetical protein